MKYLKITSLENRFRILIVKDLDNKFYMSSNGTKFQRDYVDKKINDEWNLVQELTEEEFYHDVERRIDSYKNSIKYYEDKIDKLTNLLEER